MHDQSSEMVSLQPSPSREPRTVVSLHTSFRLPSTTPSCRFANSRAIRRPGRPAADRAADSPTLLVADASAGAKRRTGAAWVLRLRRGRDHLRHGTGGAGGE